MNVVVHACIDRYAEVAAKHRANVPARFFEDNKHRASLLGDAAMVDMFIANTYHLWQNLHAATEQEDRAGLGEFMQAMRLEAAAPQMAPELRRVLSELTPDEVRTLLAAMKRVVVYVITYVHVQRQPTTLDGQPRYKANFQPIVKIAYQSRLWKLNLVY